MLRTQLACTASALLLLSACASQVNTMSTAEKIQIQSDQIATLVAAERARPRLNDQSRAAADSLHLNIRSQLDGFDSLSAMPADDQQLVLDQQKKLIGIYKPKRKKQCDKDQILGSRMGRC